MDERQLPLTPLQHFIWDNLKYQEGYCKRKGKMFPDGSFVTTDEMIMKYSLHKCSRGTVRTALKRFEQLGLAMIIERGKHSGKGTVVKILKGIKNTPTKDNERVQIFDQEGSNLDNKGFKDSTPSNNKEKIKEKIPYGGSDEPVIENKDIVKGKLSLMWFDYLIGICNTKEEFIKGLKDKDCNDQEIDQVLLLTDKFLEKDG